MIALARTKVWYPELENTFERWHSLAKPVQYLETTQLELPYTYGRSQQRYGKEYVSISVKLQEECG